MQQEPQRLGKKPTSGVDEPAGISHLNPDLAKGTYIQRLQAFSTNAIGQGTADTNVTEDIDGHLRDTSPDIGADEFVSSGIIRKPVSESEVGVSWLRSGTIKSPESLRIIVE